MMQLPEIRNSSEKYLNDAVAVDDCKKSSDPKKQDVLSVGGGHQSSSHTFKKPNKQSRTRLS